MVEAVAVEVGMAAVRGTDTTESCMDNFYSSMDSSMDRFDRRTGRSYR